MKPNVERLNPRARAYYQKLFSRMPPELERRMDRVDRAAGEAPIQDMSRVRHVYFLLSGSVYALNEQTNGDVYQYARFEAPCIFGEYEAYAGSEWYRGTIVCETACSFARMPVEDFLAWMRGDAELLFERTREVTQNLLRQVRAERNRLFHRGMDRLCILLITLAARDGEIRCSRQSMAERIGCSGKTVQRCLRKLEELNLITLAGRKIIVSPEQMARLRNYKETIVDANTEEEFL